MTTAKKGVVHAATSNVKLFKETIRGYLTEFNYIYEQT